GLIPAKNLKTYNYAISRQNGFVEFYLSEYSLAHSMQSEIAGKWGIIEKLTVPSITLEKFITDEGIQFPIDVLKIDIEGAEVDAILSLPCGMLQQIKQIPVEFHDFLETNKVYKTEMANSLKKLKGNNFLILKYSTYDHCQVLCINQSLIKLNFNQKLRLKLIHPLLQTIKLLHTFISRLFKIDKTTKK
ncbi:MAG: hypothetical protein JWQ57_4402, partial [Mucilaginibacter sp.]|nr:hypothetical protein [Mucilaginibacter sp.]